ncbi:MAG: TolC family protein [Burkholderiales bacterium]|nr:TolC family protein [Burkholderiales bacterium]
MPLRNAVLAVGIVTLAGCATVNVDRAIAQANQDASAFTNGALSLTQNADQRANASAAVAQLLASPLDQERAVRVALLNSANLQALLAQHWANSAMAAQSGRLPNPILTLERVRTPSETEIGRLLAFGLLDLLTLPQRYRTAQARIDQLQLQLSADVIGEVTEVRQAWVAAVAAQQSLGYAQQVFDSAEASAELARRMYSVGNFTKLQRARQQSFYADAATQLAAASHAATASREAFVRKLGLSQPQAASLKLPDRLPDIPAAPQSAIEVSQTAATERLDVRIAQASLQSAARAQGLSWLTSLTDIEMGVIRNTAIEREDGHRTTARGVELEIKLPLFDWGDAQRAAMSAQTLVAANRLEAITHEANSRLREVYSAYRTSYDVAKHYRDEIVPLRKQIAEENVLRYNGMLIGVFELLADARDQVGSVIAAINAQQQFWMADAALRAAMIGKPMSAPMMGVAPAAGGGGDAPH